MPGAFAGRMGGVVERNLSSIATNRRGPTDRFRRSNAFQAIKRTPSFVYHLTSKYFIAGKFYFLVTPVEMLAFPRRCAPSHPLLCDRLNGATAFNPHLANSFDLKLFKNRHLQETEWEGASQLRSRERRTLFSLPGICSRSTNAVHSIAPTPSGEGPSLSRSKDHRCS
jgi:hypothetical protein